jgi:hypothetical protein
MEKLTVKNENVKSVIQMFGLSYRRTYDVSQSLEFVKDQLDTVEEVNIFQMWLALFLEKKVSVEVEVEDNGVWRKEIVESRTEVVKKDLVFDVTIQKKQFKKL